ncbi:hypothetical protein GSI_02145 [Ganoderma sinense ZZ0214-1]|uniref:F-box domain-containing protein n=1 Tax=Ganoderma sinense ZZ0214-1 TaxID=1077348 RepID=A0A2G8SPB7_9APHY|nr:hypothetical protein GSI_02145 [Ganoderma sinense ZZ0214-1]
MLCDLPDDVLFLILYELDVHSLLRCKQVCCTLKHVIEGSQRLTYTIELGINGMIDGPSTAGQSVGERLQALRQYNAQVYAGPSTSQDVEEYEGSGWSEVQKAAARHGCCPTAYVLDHGRTLVVNEPRFAQGSLEVRRRIVSLEPGMVLVAVDISQDLLVLYKDRPDNLWNKGVHLRSLGAQVGTAHPEATLAVLKNVPFSVPTIHLGDHDNARTSIKDGQIYGPFVAWKVPYDDRETTYALEVWDWKKGILVWHGRFPSLSISTYTLIDMAYLAVELWGRKVAVYRFSSPEIDSTYPSFDITSQPSVAAIDIKDTTPLFSLELFPHARDCCIVEPSPCTISPLPPPAALFWPDPALRTIAVQFHVSASSKLRNLLGDSLNSTFVVLIPQSTFREHLERASARTEGDGPLRVPWRDWGERGSVVLRSGTFPEQPHLAGLYTNSRVVPFGSRVSVFLLDSADELETIGKDKDYSSLPKWRFQHIWGSYDLANVMLHPEKSVPVFGARNLVCIDLPPVRQHMQVLAAILFAAASGAAAVAPYQQYILAPSSRTVRPAAVYLQTGSVSSEHALLDDQVFSGQPSLTLDTFNSSVTYDFGKNVGGWINFNTTSIDGSVGFTFTESSLWVSSEACDSTSNGGLDEPLVFNLTGLGHYVAPNDKERGAFRYLTIVNLGSDQVSIDDLWVHFTAMPHWADDSLQNYTGWFHSNDEKLNRVWYAGAYTNQLITIDPTRGDAIVHFGFGNISNTTLDWWLNTTITNGTSTLTDGAKRDRLVWSGDMAIAVPGIAITTFDLISIRNALDSLFVLQNANGQLPYAGYPFNILGVVSFTYHLYALIGVRNFYHWSGDQSYFDEKWLQWKAGMEWAVARIDSTGLANITDPADWLRFGMGGHNIEANSILFYTLNLGATLAQNQDDSATADRWSQLAASLQSAAIPLLWQPDVGLFKDNETTTLAPQDGNAWAVKSGLVTNASQVAQISEALQARWGPYGAPAPEAADAISPFISGFELETHFMANRTVAALTLIRNMWADFMLDDPRMTNSTFIEGYSTTGELHYAPYPNNALISHAHGWSTGPMSALTTYVGGIQLLSEAGATWAIVPQVGDLTHADVGFSTSLGGFSSKWSTNTTVFHLEISTPEGSTGTVGLLLPGNHTSAILTGKDRDGDIVHGDKLGRYWVGGLAGGDYEFTVVGL